MLHPLYACAYSHCTLTVLLLYSHCTLTVLTSQVASLLTLRPLLFLLAALAAVIDSMQQARAACLLAGLPTDYCTWLTAY